MSNGYSFKLNYPEHCPECGTPVEHIEAKLYGPQPETAQWNLWPCGHPIQDPFPDTAERPS